MNNIKGNITKRLVSIGMPVYNGEKYIRRALESILGQTYSNLEVVVSDNASTDSTKEILSEFALKDPRLKLHFQKENIGILRNFHYVLDHSGGDFFFWAACDDWWDPQFIFVLKGMLDDHPNFNVAMCSYKMINDDGEDRGEVLLAGENNLTNASYNRVFQRMIGRSPIHVFFYGLFRSDFLKKVMKRPFPNCMMGDRVLMSEVSLATHLLFIGDFLHCRTVHDLTLSERYRNEEFGFFWKDKIRFFRLFWIMINRLVTSPLIPWKRKIRSVPLGWFRLIARGTWTMGKLGIREIFKKN